jgi:hypothetical protein
MALMFKYQDINIVNNIEMFLTTTLIMFFKYF